MQTPKRVRVDLNNYLTKSPKPGRKTSPTTNHTSKQQTYYQSLHTTPPTTPLEREWAASSRTYKQTLNHLKERKK